MTERRQIRKKIGLSIILIVLFFFLGYTLYEMKKVVFGPQITISSPLNGSLASSSLIEIIGVAKNIKEISLNDRKIFIDEKGNFKEKVLLSYGYNVIVIKASDKFDSKTEKVLEVIYK